MSDTPWSLDDLAAMGEAREASAAEVTGKGWSKRLLSNGEPKPHHHPGQSVAFGHFQFNSDLQ